LIALRIAAKLLNATPEQLAAGCLTGGDSITISDALLILRIAAGLAGFD